MMNTNTIMRTQAILMLILLFFSSCTNKDTEMKNTVPAIDKKGTNAKLEFVSFNHSEFYDTLYCDVKMIENGKKIIFGDIKEQNIKIKESGFDSLNAPIFIESKYLKDKNVIGDISILILMDVSASIDPTEVKKQKEAIKQLKELLPNNKIYFSLMDASITPTQEFSVADLNYALDKASERPPSEKHLYIDDVKEYVNAAKKIGWDGIHFKNYVCKRN